MMKESAIKKNLDLLNEFMRYAFDNPEVLEKIPPEAEVVILPVDDQELCEYNKKMADRMFSQGKTIVLVKMKRPKPLVPELELMMPGTVKSGGRLESAGKSRHGVGGESPLQIKE